MNHLLQLATNVSTPIALAGLVVAVLLLVYRQLLKLGVFAGLSRNHTFLVINRIITLLFYLALVATILGFAGYLAAPLLLSFTDSNMEVVDLVADASRFDDGTIPLLLTVRNRGRMPGHVSRAIVVVDEQRMIVGCHGPLPAVHVPANSIDLASPKPVTAALDVSPGSVRSIALRVGASTGKDSVAHVRLHIELASKDGGRVLRSPKVALQFPNSDAAVADTTAETCTAAQLALVRQTSKWAGTSPLPIASNGFSRESIPQHAGDLYLSKLTEAPRVVISYRSALNDKGTAAQRPQEGASHFWGGMKPIATGVKSVVWLTATGSEPFYVDAIRILVQPTVAGLLPSPGIESGPQPLDARYSFEYTTEQDETHPLTPALRVDPGGREVSFSIALLPKGKLYNSPAIAVWLLYHTSSGRKGRLLITRPPKDLEALARLLGRNLILGDTEDDNAVAIDSLGRIIGVGAGIDGLRYSSLRGPIFDVDVKRDTIRMYQTGPIVSSERLAINARLRARNKIDDVAAVAKTGMLLFLDVCAGMRERSCRDAFAAALLASESEFRRMDIVDLLAVRHELVRDDLLVSLMSEHPELFRNIQNRLEWACAALAVRPVGAWQQVLIGMLRSNQWYEVAGVIYIARTRLTPGAAREAAQIVDSVLTVPDNADLSILAEPAKLYLSWFKQKHPGSAR